MVQIEATIEEREKQAPPLEEKIVEEIVQKFIFNTDKKQIDQVDLNLALKALPVRIDETNCRRVELFNFPGRQQAIIAY